ncbi:MAG: hypothetical protein ABI051_10905 [Vicinamibacterales bacterium]
MVIRRVRPMSVAKVAGAVYALIGLLIGALVSLAALAVGTTMPAESHFPAALGLLFGAGAIIALPIFYGVMGFVFTAIAAAIYNLVAGVVGGIEIEVDGDRSSSHTPTLT